MMMIKNKLTVAALVAAALLVAACDQPVEKKQENTAVVAEKVPTFEQYPSGPLYAGATADLADRKDPYRTRNAEALKDNKIVYASEYVISSIGCGTACLTQRFVSKRTGELLPDQLNDSGEERIKEVNPESLLVITAGPEDDANGKRQFFKYYYVLENGKFKRLARVAADLPECQGNLNCVVDSPY